MIVAQSGKLGSGVKESAENRKSDQTRGDVRARRAFDMQIEDEGAVHSENAKKRELNLEMARFEAAIENRENEHDGREGKSGPIICEKSPSSGCSGERA